MSDINHVEAFLKNWLQVPETQILKLTASNFEGFTNMSPYKFTCKDALALVRSNDLIVYEDLKIQNVVKNHRLAKSISDASWYRFTQWLNTISLIKFYQSFTQFSD